MEARGDVRAVAGVGLAGDRYALATGTYSKLGARPRHVTLIECEALDGARRDESIELAGRETRRNIVTEGVALNHLVGRTFRVGGALLRGVKLAEPCAYLEGLLGRPGARAALVHRGGLRAEILEGGVIRVNDVVDPDDGA
jgi:MOSC domain-containing protein YiiM